VPARPRFPIRPIVDDHGLTERLTQLRRDLANAHVGSASCDRWNDDPDRFAWKALRADNTARYPERKKRSDTLRHHDSFLLNEPSNLIAIA
jgi:hypothetical protein